MFLSVTVPEFDVWFKISGWKNVYRQKSKYLVLSQIRSSLRLSELKIIRLIFFTTFVTHEIMNCIKCKTSQQFSFTIYWTSAQQRLYFNFNNMKWYILALLPIRYQLISILLVRNTYDLWLYHTVLIIIINGRKKAIDVYK